MEKMISSVLFIRKGDRHRKIRVQDIQYIIAAGSYLEIITLDEIFSVPQNLSQFVRKNQIASLVRVHRSYIVNLNRVDSFDHEYIYSGQHQIPIGEKFREQFMEEIRCF
jgi:DNA-binding LytR/AlgR family response regulator